MRKIFICLLAGVLLLVGCSQKVEAPTISINEEVITEKPEKWEDEAEEIETEDLTNKKISPLTGLYIDEDAADRRPVAVMINNLHKALPQSGIGQASVIYEALAEGEITRFLAVFQEFDASKIGPIRSSRHYFLDLCLDNDAIYVHHGGSELAYNAIRKLKINNLDGMALDGSVFFRDKVRYQQPGMKEHSSYSSAENLLDYINEREFRMTPNENIPIFKFYDEDTDIKGIEALDVLVPYSSYQISEFIYDWTNKQYKRYQTGNEHIDELTGEIIAVKNILVQYVDTWVIPNDTEGRRDMKLIGSGKGHFITNGTAVPITWSKKSHEAATEYYDENNMPLTINKGKTWIFIYPSNKEVNLNALTED